MPFQSTRPVWGETIQQAAVDGAGKISIHSPRVGRDGGSSSTHKRRIYFNPLAPCGARHVAANERLHQVQFQSTRPVWGETPPAPEDYPEHYRFQSTRPVWGETTSCSTSRPGYNNFNPLAPCGARRTRIIGVARKGEFQSTRPVWGETLASILSWHIMSNFNPLAPCGARQKVFVTSL